MKRFYRGRKEYSLYKLIFSVVLFLAIGICFYYGIHSVSSRTDREQLKSLEEAINRSIASCYATEGQYPQSLDYLKQQYGIEYDSEKYFVDYQIAGANILPDVTIIEK